MRRTLLGLFGTLGAASVITQAVLLRELLCLLQGLELLLGVALGVWLAAITLGAWLGGRLTARLDPGRLGSLLHGLTLLAALVPVGQVLLLRLGRVVLDVPAGLTVPPGPGLALLAVALTPFAFLVGLTFPLGSRCWQEASAPATPGGQGAVGGAIGHLYTVEAVGALLGGLLCSLVLANQLGNLLTAGVGGAALLVATAVSAAGLRSKAPDAPDQGWRLVAAGGLAWLVALLALLALRPLELRTQQLRLAALDPGAALVEVFDTPHGNQLLARHGDQTTLYEDGVPTVSFPDPFQDGPRIAQLLVQHPRPRRVCLLGGGMAGAVTQLLAAGMERVVVVQPDRILAERLARHLPGRDQASLADSRVQLVLDDPRRYLSTAAESFDLVYLVQPDPATLAINRYYTLEFFRLVARRLAPDGVVAFRVSGGANVLGPEAADLNALLYFTLNQQFPDVLALPGETITFLAARAPGVLTTDMDVLDGRLEALPGRPDAFRAPQLEEAVPRARIRQLLDTLGTRPALLNRDQRPLGPLYHLLLWARRDRGPVRGEDVADPLLGLLRELTLLDHRLPALGMVLLLLPAVLLLRRRLDRPTIPPGGASRRGAALLTLLLVGFSAMASEVALLLAYQEYSGALYQMIALLVALFMAGLALGSGLATRMLRTPSPPADRDRLLAGLGLGLLLLSVALPLVVRQLNGLGSLPVTLLCGGLLVLVGALTGGAFPLAAAQAAGEAQDGRTTGLVAGQADALDHGGACLGALLTGALLLPLFGLVGVSLVQGALAAGLIALWWRMPDPPAELPPPGTASAPGGEPGASPQGSASPT